MTIENIARIAKVASNKSYIESQVKMTILSCPDLTTMFTTTKHGQRDQHNRGDHDGYEEVGSCMRKLEVVQLYIRKSEAIWKANHE